MAGYETNPTRKSRKKKTRRKQGLVLRDPGRAPKIFRIFLHQEKRGFPHGGRD